MKVLMLGWEFPPYIAGGLGTACYGLTRAINDLGVDVLFVLPRPVEPKPANGASHLSLADPQYAFSHAHMAAEAAHDQSGGYEPAAESAAPAPPAAEFPAPPVAAAPPVATLVSTPPQTPPQPPAPRPEVGPAYRVEGFERVTFRRVNALLQPYATAEVYEETLREYQQRLVRTASRPTPTTAPASGPTPEPTPSQAHIPTPPSPPPAPAPGKTAHLRAPVAAYAASLHAEVVRYARLVESIAATESFDLVHAHDWMTFRAGIAAAERAGKPLIVHVHSTEFDRNGRNPDPEIVATERAGVQAAAKVIAVSNLTKRMLVAHYGVSPDKIEVIHNAVEIPAAQATAERLQLAKDEKIVLFLGRITAQKGPEYFLAAARKVLDVYPDVKFIMAGAGDLVKPTIELAAAMDIGHKVLFTGFLSSQDVQRVFQMADLYVMPSVSEPFGIAPLEAIAHDVPVIISKQSGVSEVLSHVLKVDFWDVDDLANKILAVLRHPALAQTLRRGSRQEVEHLTWPAAAEKVAAIYDALTGVAAA